MNDESKPVIRPQLSIRTLLELTAVVAVIMAFYFSRSPSAVGRYSLFQQAPGSALLLDTKTGQTWYMDKATKSWYPDMPAVKEQP
jgi:hypothetical protein